MRPKLTAKTADRHVLYEASVQATDVDVAFIDRVFRRRHGVRPQRLREDFCGTAKLCAEWVKGAPTRHAVGVDLHQPTMDWGRRVHLEPLGAAAARARLVCCDVREGPGGDPVDVAVAFNFSYCALKARQDMLAYMRNVHAGLTRGGIFFLDLHGGSECFDELEETTKHRGFTYVWDQAPFDPISGFATRHIHFRFADGSEMRRAFTYDWRLWHLPELRDLLYEAGFAAVDVYWEGADAKGAGTGVFKKVRRATNELSWIAYLVAHRSRP